MSPGWLERAIVATFGDADEDTCTVCGGHRYVDLVAFAGELMDEPIPCPSCRRAPPPLPVYRWDWRADSPEGAA